MSNLFSEQKWSWWPLFPLYPYGRKKTIFRELVPNQIWSFEQLQGIYYVAVPVRLLVVRVKNELMIINPLPPTDELLREIYVLEKKIGPVKTIVLPTASGLEHKIALPALARAFPDSRIWVCPGQWSFPFKLPLDWLGIPSKRTNILLADGFPHNEYCDWIPLGPIDIGLGRFQEISCFHKPSKSLLVTDALVAIEETPPELFDFDPTPLLFHSREKGSEELIDTPISRRKGWLRLVLFASYLRPEKLVIPKIKEIFRNSFKPKLRNKRAHFGIYPFAWQKGWELSAKKLVGKNSPLIQIAPVIERLVFPRGQKALIKWLNKVESLQSISWLISAHYSGKVKLSKYEIKKLKNKINKVDWANNQGDFGFLGWLDQKLLDIGVVPKDPLKKFSD
ncbi:DUF4336 domain-containing protein [Prochlorococcus marinus]|uniref:DUF4336 domain-containing protein n=1 Tax=Prochlorococcus marinus TaxID=1219 RepID=UPI0022B5420D|nr:DUF4336 domain-containing protein [Prochlorococcus marinus]